MKAVTRTFVAYVEDRPGVLNRVASLFRRRAFNIESLTVGGTERAGCSRMTVVMTCDDDTARRVVSNLYKLVDILSVEEVPGGHVVRDLALVKVRAAAAGRAEVLKLCEVFRARPVDVGPEALIVEITGTQDKIDGLVEVLKPFGILEMVRTGAVAMTRGAQEATRAERPEAPPRRAAPAEDALSTEEVEDTWQPSTTTPTRISG